MKINISLIYLTFIATIFIYSPEYSQAQIVGCEWCFHQPGFCNVDDGYISGFDECTCLNGCVCTGGCAIAEADSNIDIEEYDLLFFDKLTKNGMLAELDIDDISYIKHNGVNGILNGQKDNNSILLKNIGLYKISRNEYMMYPIHDSSGFSGFNIYNCKNGEKIAGIVSP